jgi:hypothetical protein
VQGQIVGSQLAWVVTQTDRQQARRDCVATPSFLVARRPYWSYWTATCYYCIYSLINNKCNLSYCSSYLEKVQGFLCQACVTVSP